MKKTLTAIIAAALVAAAPASASVVLTQNEAHKASKTSAEQTLGTLSYRSIGSADVRVSNCRVHGRRGVCRVVVNGIQKCDYVAHVLETNGEYMVWATGIRCGR